jgi:hypothetical protein
MEELVRDVKDKIQKVESSNVFMKLESPLNSRIPSINLYLAKLIDFLHSKKIMNNEIIRNLFDNDTCLSWILKLNILQFNDEAPVEFVGWAGDITSQWFWTLKWKFLKGMLIPHFLFHKPI